MTTTLEMLNRLDRAAFTAALGSVFENSPWVAEKAFSCRPFPSVDDLYAAMVGALRSAPREAQLTLLRAHPDLAGKLPRDGALRESSVAEQASIGLDRLTDAEARRFDRLNAAYRRRFGFPFIIAVRRHTKASILEVFESRFAHTGEEEVVVALDEVGEIARLRLRERITG